MWIRQLELRDFRICSSLVLSLDAQTTYIVGNNAQGKTSVLEAVYLLGHGASFRTSARDDLIRHGAAQATISAQLERHELRDHLTASLSSDGRRLQRNGKNVRSPDESWPHVILFAPEETLLFKGAPQGRRDYLDGLCEGIDRSYATLRRNYQRVVQQRNRVLKEGALWPRARLLDVIAPWTAQLIEAGVLLIAHRARWIAALSEELPSVYQSFAAVDGEIRLLYRPQVEDADAYRQQIEQRFEEEAIRGISLVGPHRDDVAVELDGRDLHHFGSQGQHRSVILSLKVAEVQLALRVRGETPVLLLDDVASELDEQRLTAFFAFVRSMHCQTIVTATDARRYLPADPAPAALWHIEAGELVTATAVR